MRAPTTPPSPLASPLAGRLGAGSRRSRRARTAARLARAAFPVLLATTSCAGGPRPIRDAASPRQYDTVIAAEMQRCVAISLYACLERERPRFLLLRGGSMTVFVGGLPWGPVAMLRNIPASDVQAVRFLSRLEATTLHGSMPGGAVLEVILRLGAP